MIRKYELNNIYNENSYAAIKDIPDDSIDLIIVDPPYEFVTGGKAGAFGGNKRTYHNEYEKISFNKHVNSKKRVWEGKKQNTEEIKYLSSGFNYEILEEFNRVLKKINIYIWCSKHQLRDLLNYYHDKDCNFEIITWSKKNAIPTANNTYMNDTEYIFFAREKGVKITGSVATKKKYYVTNVNTADKKKFVHPTIKPLEIIKNLIINSSEEEDVVADFFVGSGTTCVAAKELNRKYLGFEIDKKFYEISKKRINGITANGQTSVFTDFDKLNI